MQLGRRGKIHSAFFSDRKHGGEKLAFAVAQKYYRELRLKLGKPKTNSRRFWGELPRRKGRSGIHSVQKIIDRRSVQPVIVWRATWGPEPYMARKKQFSVRKHGQTIGHTRTQRRLAEHEVKAIAFAVFLPSERLA